MKASSHAKVAPPRLHRAILRTRLFHRLDSLSGYPVTWISSPAGSGKTTLIASYVRKRNIPVLWYRVDAGDSDVGTFFYYMAEAAKTLRRKRQPLPLFAPDFRAGIEAFTRHYFSALFAKMPTPGLLVFDNYQDAPEECEFHEVVRNGLRLLPEGMRAVIASRQEPPAPFISLKADRYLSSLGWDELRFTLDEVRQIMQSIAKGELPEETVQRVYEQTHGWAAAVILMMDEDGPPTGATSVGSGAVFDYFAVEVFRKLGDRTRDFLCTTALLPSISPDVASRLTGVEEAGTLLAYLSRNHYFTEWHGAGYIYHPLFREFLISQARKSYDPEALRALHVEAARTLVDFGRAEEAVKLLLDVAEHAEALPVILGHAPRLLAQGRTDTLEEWAERLTGEMRENVPWLLYWRALGRLVTNPHESKQFLEKAFGLFEAQEDRIGCLFAVAGIMNAIFFTWDDCHPFDEWITWIDRNVDIDTVLTPVELEAQVASAMVCALTWRQPNHPNTARWVSRALEAAGKVEDPMIRCVAKGNVMDYYGCRAEVAEVNHIGDEFLHASCAPQPSPLISLVCMVRGWNLFHRQLSAQEAVQLSLQTIRLAEDIGACFHLGMVYYPAAVAAFEAGDQMLCAELVEKMGRFAGAGKRHFLARFLNLRTFTHLLAGRLGEALKDADDAVRAAEETGMPYGEAVCRIGLAHVLRLMGRREDAWEQTKKIEKVLRAFKRSGNHYFSQLIRASLLFDEGRTVEARRTLSDAFCVGREHGMSYVLAYHWQPDEMARLCREALSAGIEVEYARELIGRHHLVPPDGRPEDLSDWPWPLKVRVFGAFDLAVDGLPPSDTRKRPIDLLKALISFGGEEVAQETIEDALWPEAEGDVAHISFKTTLSRLRKIIGEKTIEVREGKATINRRMVWLDLWALESLAERVFELGRRHESAAVPELERLAGLALDIYRGDFLCAEDTPWVERPREHLRTRFAKTIERLCRMLSDAGEYARANDLCEDAVNRGIPVASLGSRDRRA